MTELEAKKLLEKYRWIKSKKCPYCDSVNFSETTHHSMPYRCRNCRKYFGTFTNIGMRRPRLSYIQIILLLKTLKQQREISTIGLANSLNITQGSAWKLKNKTLPILHFFNIEN